MAGKYKVEFGLTENSIVTLELASKKVALAIRSQLKAQGIDATAQFTKELE